MKRIKDLEEKLLCVAKYVRFQMEAKYECNNKELQGLRIQLMMKLCTTNTKIPLGRLSMEHFKLERTKMVILKPISLQLNDEEGASVIKSVKY